MTPAACGLVQGTTFEGIAVGATLAGGHVLSGFDDAAERAEKSLPWQWIRDIPRAGETIVKYAVPGVTLMSTVYEACAYRAEGEAWSSAIGRSAFANGGAFVGAAAGAAACALLLPAGGFPALACAGGAALAGGVVGHEAGSRLWDAGSQLWDWATPW
jgi:hypothetical protein